MASHVVAPWYSSPGIKRLDSLLLQQIRDANRSGGLSPSAQLVERTQGDDGGLSKYGHLFDGKYYAACITVWINKRTDNYSLCCTFADIEGVLTTRNIPMSLALLSCCDIAMSQILEWLELGILQPRPFQLESTEGVLQLLAELDKEEDELAACADEVSVPMIVFVPVYPCRVGFKQLKQHFKAEAEQAEKLIEAGIQLEGSSMDELTRWMTNKDQIGAFVLCWDCPPDQGWTPLNFSHSRL